MVSSLNRHDETSNLVRILSSAFFVTNAIMDAVLGTLEMVEAILLQTDLKTLLLVQRVCKSWHNIVTRSPWIQKRLFFQPDFEAKTRRINPLLGQYFRPWFPEPGNKSHVIFGGSALRSLPLIQPDRRDAFRYANASWRRMLPRQPPIETLFCCYKVAWMDGTSVSLSQFPREKFRNTYDREGEGPFMRMEMLYEEVVVGAGSAEKWGFFWHNGTQQVQDPWPAEMVKRMDTGSRHSLDSALEEHGLVMFQSVVMQCTAFKGPFFLGTEFWLENGQALEFDSEDELIS
jgi:hypothetical protein